MKKLFKVISLIFILFIFSFHFGFSQTVVFTDDFSTNTSATYTTTGAIGSSVFSVTRAGADWGARRNTSPLQLELTNDAGATTNVAGWVYASVPLSGFTIPYNTTLVSNPGIITWTFNMRTNRTSALAGFSATTSYGMAMVLVSSSNTPNTTGTGYAVVMGGGAANNIGLIKFNNGLQGTKTTVIGFGNTPTALTDYISVKVTYDPSTNQWQLFSRDDGNSAFADPASGTLTQIGTATVDNTYTSTAMSYSGAYWQGSTSSTQTSFFDNFKVTVISASVPNIALSSPSQVTAGDVFQGSTDVILSRFQADVTTSNAMLSSLSFVTAGTYASSDISNFKLYYSTTNSFPGGTALSTQSTANSGSTITFSGLNQSITSSTTGYFWITGDISSNAAPNNTINASASPVLTFTSGNLSGSITAGGSQTFKQIIPQITLNASNPAVIGGNINQNSTNNIIYAFNLSVTTANATISGLNITTSGNYSATDITNFKAWYSSDNTFSPATDVLLSTITPVTTAGVQNFTSWTNQLITNNSTGYFFITSDIPCSAVNGNTISVDALTTLDITFLSGQISGNAYPSEAQTIQYSVPNNPGSLSISSPGSGQETSSWTNPSGCFDEVMLIVSTATISETPTGNGSSYSGNLTYGSGTSFGGGYVVYKGSTSPQTVSGLTDGTTYYFKFFTRNGTTWSSGIETSSFLAAPIFPGNIYITHLSADYNGASDEFVVLFNNTLNPIDLNGYELKYFSAGGSTGGAGYLFNTSTIIQPSKHLLLSPNATITVGSVNNKARDLSFTSGMAPSGQLVLRQTSNTSNIIFAVAWGTISSFVAGMTESTPWPADGMISLTPSGTTYIYSGSSDYSFSNTDYSHTLSANIFNVPSSSDGTLPVHLTSLNSISNGRDITIKWSTESELNNAGFNIERKTNNENWTIAGFVKGSGTTNINSDYSFTDRKLNSGKYEYRLKQIDNNGNFTYYNLQNTVEIGIPKKFNLLQNYPNPFNPVTKIDYELPADSRVNILVYDILGREVKTLVSNEMKQAGYYTIEFNAGNLASGIYFCRMVANNSNENHNFIKRMAIIK